jgi:hypothetical protein
LQEHKGYFERKIGEVSTQYQGNLEKVIGDLQEANEKVDLLERENANLRDELGPDCGESEFGAEIDRLSMENFEWERENLQLKSDLQLSRKFDRGTGKFCDADLEYLSKILKFLVKKKLLHGLNEIKIRASLLANAPRPSPEPLPNFSD